jgi:DNA-binding NarL/FixJ family response regulator
MATSCLIVDDNVTYTAALRIQLERDGISVVGVAPTAVDALRLIVERRPDIALVDELGRSAPAIGDPDFGVPAPGRGHGRRRGLRVPAQVRAVGEVGR